MEAAAVLMTQGEKRFQSKVYSCFLNAQEWRCRKLIDKVVNYHRQFSTLYLLYFYIIQQFFTQTRKSSVLFFDAKKSDCPENVSFTTYSSSMEHLSFALFEMIHAKFQLGCIAQTQMRPLMFNNLFAGCLQMQKSTQHLVSHVTGAFTSCMFVVWFMLGNMCFLASIYYC